MNYGVFAPSDLHGLMFGLLYPAVLGTFFYSLLPILFGAATPKKRRPASCSKTATGVLIVIHFIVDFQLTGLLPPEGYGFVGFVVDLLILVVLFRAFDAVNVSRPNRPLDLRRAATSMALTYVLFLVWSFFTLEGTLVERLSLWGAEVAGFILFMIVARRGSVTSLCWSLLFMSIIMAILGSMAVGPLRAAAAAART